MKIKRMYNRTIEYGVIRSNGVTLDKRPFIPYGKITKINRRKNTLLSYIINKVVSELGIIMPIVITHN